MIKLVLASTYGKFGSAKCDVNNLSVETAERMNKEEGFVFPANDGKVVIGLERYPKNNENKAYTNTL